jgi:hypothetical protein
MDEQDPIPERKWHRIYVAVVLTTVFVLLALWAFSGYFTPTAY